MQWLTFIMMVIFFSTSAQSTVTAGNELCPDQFEGQVKTIADELGPETAFSTQKVVFENHQTIKGEVTDFPSLEVLKSGPFKIEAGKDYRVLLRKGKLCWIEQI